MAKHYHTEILRIAVPSILSNITVPLLGLVDLTIVGHLGAASYIGAIAIGGTIFNMIYWIFAFLRMGTSGLTSQACGADNKQEMANLLYRSLVSSIFIASLVLILQYPLLQLALHVMSPTPAISSLASEYFYICVWGAPAVLGLYSITGWFIGLQEARYSLYIAIIQNVVNILASIYFVFGLGMNITGVAAGTLIAQYCGLFVSLYLCRHLHHRLHIPTKFYVQQVFCQKTIQRFFSVNRDIFLRTLCLVGVTLYFTSAGSQQGEIILAVNALLMQYFTLYSYFMDGFAFAGEALAGKCMGAKDHKALATVIKNLFTWGLGVAVLFTALYGLGGQAFMTLLTNEENVIEQASAYLPWTILIPFAGLAAFTWDGVFIGLTATKYMLLSMCMATLAFFGTYLLLAPFWHNHALWLAFLLYLCIRGATLHIVYKNMSNQKTTCKK